jgi:gliding-associated putative ABC transporter substrate-binding component GldG
MFTQDLSHPIVSHLDPVKLEFASTLDTVNNGKGIKKTPLLISSKYSKTLQAPIRINTSIVSLGQNYFEANKGEGHLTAVLLEGVFSSAFYEKLPTSIRTEKNIGFRDKSIPTAMIVISDGDVVKNGLIPVQNGYAPIPLGFDRYVNEGKGAVIYDNREFLLNCINYLLDDKSLISVRSRTIKLRKLDTKKIAHQKIGIQLANTALPLSLVFALGIGQYLIRRKKWSKKGK